MPDWVALLGEVTFRLKKVFGKVTGGAEGGVRTAMQKITGQRLADGSEMRVDERALITIPVLAMFSDRAVESKIFDIAEGGMRILAPRRVKRGEHITLRIHQQVDKVVEKLEPVENTVKTKTDLMSELNNFKSKLDAAKGTKPKPKPQEPREEGAPTRQSEEISVPKVASLNPDWMQQGDGPGGGDKIIKVWQDAPVQVINIEVEARWCAGRAGGEFNVGVKFLEGQSEAMKKWKRDLLFTMEVAKKAKDKTSVQITDKPMVVGEDPRAGKVAPKFTKVKKSVAEAMNTMELLDPKKREDASRLEDDGSWMQIKSDYRNKKTGGGDSEPPPPAT